MSLTIVNTPYEGAKTNAISIKPFFDKNKSNLGLEKYGISLYDGVFHDEQLGLIERNGVKRYLTGLNEFAPEIKAITDKELREAKIREIREVVSQLEKELAANYIDPKDPDFWNKVVLLKPNNDEFWSKITLRCGNQPVILDPAKDPYDLIKLYAIEAGGFSICARSLEHARTMSVAPKFFLDKYVETVSTHTEVTKLKNRAFVELQKLYDKNSRKLYYVAKVVDNNSVQYKQNTPNDIIYDNMDRFISGESYESNIRRAAQTFLDAAALDMETLKLKAMVKDATFYKFVHIKPDGFIYHMESNALMGRNTVDCVEFLKNPLNEQVLISLTKQLEQNWVK